MNTEESEAAAPPPEAARKSETVQLQEPLRGGTITSVEVRKPKPFEMRGLSLQSIVQADVNTMIALLPKITVPPLLTHEIENDLDPADMIGLAGAVSGFFYTKAEKEALARVLGQIEPESGTG